MAQQAETFCNCIVCGGGPVKCQVRAVQPTQWPPETAEEFDAEWQRRRELDRFDDGPDLEREAEHDDGE